MEELGRLHARFGLRPACMWPALEALPSAPVSRLDDVVVAGVVPLAAYWAIHFSAVGAVLNGLFLLAFGWRLENRAGWLRFGLFGALCVLSAAFAHLLFEREATSPALGGSALTAGTIGAYLVWYWRSKVTVFVPVLFVPAFVAVGAPILAIAWAAVQFEPVQRLLTRGTGHPLCYGALLVAAAVGVLGSPLLWPKGRRGRR